MEKMWNITSRGMLDPCVLFVEEMDGVEGEKKVEK